MDLNVRKAHIGGGQAPMACTEGGPRRGRKCTSTNEEDARGLWGGCG